MAHRNRALWLILSLLSVQGLAQTTAPALTTETFRATRVVNYHNTEVAPKGILDFRIAHRFAPLSTKLNNLYGIEGPATIQFRLDYSITDRLTAGIGRASIPKMADAFIKFKWLRQRTDNSMPISLAMLTSINVKLEKDATASLTGLDRYSNFNNRLAYLFQVMVSRKFNDALSLQVSPMLIHYNLVERLNDKNDILAVAFSGRYKITRHLALSGEYALRTLRYSPDQKKYHNVMSWGVDIETSGHVFQLFLTNGYNINEVVTVPFSSGEWSGGNMMLGFNISRSFNLRKTK